MSWKEKMKKLGQKALKAAETANDFYWDKMDGFEKKIVGEGGIDGKMDTATDKAVPVVKDAYGKAKDKTVSVVSGAAKKVADKTERTATKVRERIPVGMVEFEICVGDEPEEGVEVEVHTDPVAGAVEECAHVLRWMDKNPLIPVSVRAIDDRMAEPKPQTEPPVYAIPTVNLTPAEDTTGIAKRIWNKINQPIGQQIAVCHTPIR